MLPQWPDSFNGSYILPDTLRARCRYEREVATVQAGVSEIECLVYCDLLLHIGCHLWDLSCVLQERKIKTIENIKKKSRVPGSFQEFP